MKAAMFYPHPDSEKGISAYSLNLISNLKKQGEQISGITFSQGKPLSAFKKLHELLRYDIIHVQHEYGLLGMFGLPYFLLFLIIGLIKKNSVIVTLHNVLSKKENFQSGRLKTFLRKILYETQNRWIDLTSAKIVVHARFFKKILIKEYGFTPDKIVVLPHPIIENIQTVSKSAARKELKLSGKVYLLIGTLVPDHGHDIVLRQANKIGKTILIASNPSAVNYKNEKKIKDFLSLNKRIVEGNEFEKFVRFDLGPISYEKWWKYISASDIVLLPYRGGIGSGIFADAMALKKPVVASKVPYFSEFASDYGCLEIAKNDEDLPRAVNDSMKPKNYLKMSKEANRYFNENGLTPISKKYISLYSSVYNQL